MFGYYRLYHDFTQFHRKFDDAQTVIDVFGNLTKVVFFAQVDIQIRLIRAAVDKGFHLQFLQYSAGGSDGFIDVFERVC